MSGYELGRLTDLIACPECHAKLVVGNRSSEAGESAESLVCTGSGCRLSFPVREGIPMLLVDEAESLEDSAWQAAVGVAVGDVSEKSETDVESETEAGEENES